mmetsp:Transcript_6051/g.6189  ORF Transcript_6051/g.6189 Transcript_6051/m.6189 type:complete len:476 (-) Transcript_6051:185-1612(-)|eukprot:CAMPEP_0119045626 /NCGR_PEP_ID=MMETSP1177-20130426/41364_1 /TAXON_ID=2985 /ORGANISM="Ochromonas sp, Strain CCMP1899" /LENGTH=475 /DNA_ID=CAMNT_0007017715 /DNA_START=96 /DNA_END=1523 /DNA_ORIENTATION=-
MAGIEMTPKLLRQYCKDNGLYATPSINDKIYLHYKGFRSIQSLEEYSGLKCIWLEGNGLSSIGGLEKQTILRTLFLQENIIEKIENLESLVELDTLNLSKNFIKKIENLSHMKKLSSLNLASNLLATAEDIQEVTLLESLQTLDIQHNKINDINILEIVSSLKDLRVLYLIGNPVIKSIKHYRKTVIARCKSLKYLDDRPVFDEERRRVEAWMAVYEIENNADAANEAERLELKLIRKEKDDVDERNFKAFEALMNSGKEIKRLRELELQQSQISGVPPVPAVNPFTGETIITVPESELLRDLREKRWSSSSGSQTLTDDTPVPPEVEPTVNPPSPPNENQLNQNGNEMNQIEKDLEVTNIDSASSSGWVKMKIEEDSLEEGGGIVEGATVEESSIENTAVVQDGSTSPLPVKRHRFSSLLTEAAAEVALDIKIAQSSLSKELNIPSDEGEGEGLTKYGSEDHDKVEATDLGELD